MAVGVPSCGVPALLRGQNVEVGEVIKEREWQSLGRSW